MLYGLILIRLQKLRVTLIVCDTSHTNICIVPPPTACSESNETYNKKEMKSQLSNSENVPFQKCDFLDIAIISSITIFNTLNSALMTVELVLSRSRCKLCASFLH